MNMTDTCKCGNAFDQDSFVLLVDGERLCTDCYCAYLRSLGTPELDIEEARAQEAQRWKSEDEEDWP